MLRRTHLWQIDWLVVALTAAIVTIGAMFIWSASYRTGTDGEGYYLDTAFKQFLWIGLGIIIAALVLLVDYHRLLKYADVLYLVGTVVLLAMLAGAPTYRQRWFRLGPVLVQPSEFMKLFLILTLAKYVPDAEKLQTLRGWLAPVVLTLCPMVLIVQQPDLGAAVTLCPVLMAILYAAGARRRHLIAVSLVGVAAAATIVATAFLDPPVLKEALQDYQKQRLVNFFGQNQSDRRAQLNELYQVTQAKIAIGSGGFFGRGWGQGTQNRLNFLPYATRPTDFILAVVAEEAGFLGAGVLLLLFFLFFVGGIGIADRAGDPQGKAIVVGLVALMATQVFINAGSATAFLPTKGMAMPFVSYGGSSAVVSFAALGLILNVGLRRRAFRTSGDQHELHPVRKVLK